MVITFICEVIGFLMAWLITSSRITGVPVAGFAVVYLLIGIASGGCITVALVVNARNFLPQDKGKVRNSTVQLYSC